MSAKGSEDPYLYPGTQILKNLRDIRDQKTLDEFEADRVAANIVAIAERPITGPFDLSRLQETHRRLFEGVYPFAGELRQTGRMVKTRESGETVSYPPSAFIGQHIESTLDQLRNESFTALDADAFAKRIAYYYAELDAAHPFREGNSRTLRMFTADIARVTGWQLTWRECSRTNEQRQALYRARDKAVRAADSRDLAAMIRSVLSPIEDEGQTETIGTAS